MPGSGTGLTKFFFFRILNRLKQLYHILRPALAMTYLSTREVADLINVTETTVKRWADEGMIDCHRTLGGHRKFLMRDVARFAEQHAYPLTGRVAPPLPPRRARALEFAVQTQDFGRMTGLFHAEVLRANSQGIYELLSYLCKHRIPIATLADEVIGPAMARIGDEWQQGKLEVNREHLASNALLESLVQLHPELHRKPAHALSAVCACAEGDYHELGIRLVSYALETEGWAVHYLGANTPTGTLRAFVKVLSPELICLSARDAGTDDQGMSRIRSVGKSARAVNATFLVGGSFSRVLSTEELQCDHVSSFISGAMDYLKDRFQLKPGPRKQ